MYCRIQVGLFINGWIIKVFTEAIIQRQRSKSRAPINKTTHSHKQLHLNVQLHLCHSRHAWSQTASFQFSQTQLRCTFFFLSHTKTQLFTEIHRNMITAHTIFLLTSTKELQVADLFSDLQLEDLLKDLLPQRLLDDSHPL